MPAGAEGACADRSLKVGLQISTDYWWCTNVVLRGVEEVCPCVLGDSWARLLWGGILEELGVGRTEEVPACPHPPSMPVVRTARSTWR